MTQEEKEILFKDLCARLPYHTRVKVWLKDGTTEEGALDLEHNYGDVLRDAFYYDKIVKIKPYLFPLSSMTEEQYNEFFSYYHNIEMAEVKASGDYLKAAYIGDDAKYSWLNKNHFDWRGLIEKGLAIDATGLNIY